MYYSLALPFVQCIIMSYLALIHIQLQSITAWPYPLYNILQTSITFFLMPNILHSQFTNAIVYNALQYHLTFCNCTFFIAWHCYLYNVECIAQYYFTICKIYNVFHILILTYNQFTMNYRFTLYSVEHTWCYRLIISLIHCTMYYSLKLQCTIY